MIYACDPHFFDAKRDDGTRYIDQMRAHGAELWTQDLNAAAKHSLFRVLGAGEGGLGRDRIHFGGNSGFQAVNLAFLWGARRIVLLGFDMQMTAGMHHWFGRHPKNQGFADPETFASWIKHFETMGRDLNDAGVSVFNATRQTALHCFPMCDVATLP